MLALISEALGSFTCMQGAWALLEPSPDAAALLQVEDSDDVMGKGTTAQAGGDVQGALATLARARAWQGVADSPQLTIWSYCKFKTDFKVHNTVLAEALDPDPEILSESSLTHAGLAFGICIGVCIRLVAAAVVPSWCKEFVVLSLLAAGTKVTSQALSFDQHHIRPCRLHGGACLRSLIMYA
jgi:hypothetical protein